MTFSLIRHHPRSENGIAVEESSTLPLIIREKDIEYQFHRIVLFDRLLGVRDLLNYLLFWFLLNAYSTFVPYFRAIHSQKVLFIKKQYWIYHHFFGLKYGRAF